MFNLTNVILYDSMTACLLIRDGSICFKPKMALIELRVQDYFIGNAIGRCLRSVYKDVEYV